MSFTRVSSVNTTEYQNPAPFFIICLDHFFSKICIVVFDGDLFGRNSDKNTRFRQYSSHCISPEFSQDLYWGLSIHPSPVFFSVFPIILVADQLIFTAKNCCFLNNVYNLIELSIWLLNLAHQQFFDKKGLRFSM